MTASHINLMIRNAYDGGWERHGFPHDSCIDGVFLGASHVRKAKGTFPPSGG